MRPTTEVVQAIEVGLGDRLAVRRSPAHARHPCGRPPQLVGDAAVQLLRLRHQRRDLGPRHAQTLLQGAMALLQALNIVAVLDLQLLGQALSGGRVALGASGHGALGPRRHRGRLSRPADLGGEFAL
jgi:hypothetical protein